MRPDPHCPLAFGNIDPFLHGINLLLLLFQNSQICLARLPPVEGIKCVFYQLFLSILNLRVVLCCSKHGCVLFLQGLRLFARQPSSTCSTAASSTPLTEPFPLSHCNLFQLFRPAPQADTEKARASSGSRSSGRHRRVRICLAHFPFICLVFPFSFSPYCPESLINFSCSSWSAFRCGLTFQQGLDDDVTSVRSYRVCM